MSGIFGGHPEDRARKAELDRYTDQDDEGDEDEYDFFRDPDNLNEMEREKQGEI